MKITRRKILISMGSLTILSLVSYRKLKSVLTSRTYPGVIQGASFSRGHVIRDPKFPKSSQDIEVKTLIVGAGVSGLSCAYHLNKKKDDDFLIVDLEAAPGGNSRGGSNKSGKYPEAAHYLPIPTDESHELKEFLFDIGVITKLSPSGDATYSEYHLCADPAERLYINGRWQPGLEPSLGLSENEQKEMERFYSLMNSFKIARGSDGKKAFAVPISKSSKDKEFLKFDQITMKDFLIEHQLNNEYINWYVDYCCKDDYGVDSSEVSAWAGIHYFASRDGKGEGVIPGKSNNLTWPEGNQFLVNHLYAPIKEKLKPNFLVFNIEKNEKDFISKGFDFISKKTITIRSENVVYASPEFTAKKIIKIDEINKILKEKDYSPWMTANILLKKRPEEQDVPLCWDNVSYYGKSLGHVISDHQSLKSRKMGTTFTQYWPLKNKNESLKSARIRALTTTHAQWCEMIVRELTLLYPNIEEDIEKIDISLFGHGMVIPTKGFHTKGSKNQIENFYFAHSDQSGISIFEEAFYQGLNAAQWIKRV